MAHDEVVAVLISLGAEINIANKDERNVGTHSPLMRIKSAMHFNNS